LEWAQASGLEEQRAYVWGDTFRSDCCNTLRSGVQGTTPVGTFPAAPSGCVDLCGNVWEMTCSTYPGDPESVIVKGGSWYDFPGHARLETRFRARVQRCGNTVGFRLIYGRHLRLPAFLDRKLVERCITWRRRGDPGEEMPEGVEETPPPAEDGAPTLDSLAMDRALELFDSMQFERPPQKCAPQGGKPSPVEPSLWRRMQALLTRHPQILILALGVALLGAVGAVWAAATSVDPSRRGERTLPVVREPAPVPARQRTRRTLRTFAPPRDGSDLERALNSLAFGTPRQRDEAERYLLWHPQKARPAVAKALGEGATDQAEASLRYIQAALEEMERPPRHEPVIVDMPPREGLVYFLRASVDGRVSEEIATVRRTAKAENLRSTAVVLGDNPGIIRTYSGLLRDMDVYLDVEALVARRWGVTRTPAVAGLRRDGRLAFVHIGHMARSRLAKRASDLARGR
ncbi:MAG: formylglycine-generating enzyme family protein, partial [Planctomycetota bacterium]